MSHAFDKVSQAVLSTDVATTNYVVTLPNHAAAGIPPKVVWVYMIGQATAGSGADDIVFSIGAAISTTNRFYLAGRSNTAVATSVCSARMAKDRICAELNTSGAGTAVGLLDVFDMSTNGQVTLRVTVQFTGSYTVTVVARGGSDITNVALFEKVPGAGGAVAITDPGFIPDYVESYTDGANVALPHTDNARMSYSIGRSTPNTGANHVVSGVALDNLATTSTMRYGRADECMAWSSNASTITFRAAITGTTAGGFVWNNIEGAGTRTMMFLCTKGASQEIGTLTSQFTTGAAIDPAFPPHGGLVMSHCEVQSTTDTLQSGMELSLGAFTEPEGLGSTQCQGFNDPDGAVGATAGATSFRADSIYVNLDSLGAVEGELTDNDAVGSADTFDLAASDADPVDALLMFAAFGATQGAAAPDTDSSGQRRGGSGDRRRRGSYAQRSRFW